MGFSTPGNLSFGGYCSPAGYPRVFLWVFVWVLADFLPKKNLGKQNAYIPRENTLGFTLGFAGYYWVLPCKLWVFTLKPNASK